MRGWHVQVAEQRRSQNMIVTLLEHMSEGCERETSMPTREQAEVRNGRPGAGGRTLL